ncbi:uncharacterized protein STAUR_7552 [Stigmatella aurantiaca DW4/3-1]|uniref:Uncharacterized protein n=1 Tax=Stigmatella aurantiaca (strain DW4/3-1) TaxID=378806 RepID=E3FH91_STIAD|nr:uncharacterized protein STAUR_7552 [Stigmatella aurantiaca DW4/3-1]
MKKGGSPLNSLPDRRPLCFHPARPHFAPPAPQAGDQQLMPQPDRPELRGLRTSFPRAVAPRKTDRRFTGADSRPVLLCRSTSRAQSSVRPRRPAPPSIRATWEHPSRGAWDPLKPTLE